MNISAIILMVVIMTIVTIATGYFFWKVLRTPAKPEPDSYSETKEKSNV